jgi:hypothetical protein
MVYQVKVKVRHQSAHGPAYTRTHIVTVVSTLHDAVVACGAMPPAGCTACLLVGMLPEISYHDAMPTCMDPPHLLIGLYGLSVKVYVHVPYQCTFEYLIRVVIPDKLESLGMDRHGTLQAGARSCCAGDLSLEYVDLQWHCAREATWPVKTRGIVALQRKAVDYVLI